MALAADHAQLPRLQANPGSIPQAPSLHHPAGDGIGSRRCPAPHLRCCLRSGSRGGPQRLPGAQVAASPTLPHPGLVTHASEADLPAGPEPERSLPGNISGSAIKGEIGTLHFPTQGSGCTLGSCRRIPTQRPSTTHHLIPLEGPLPWLWSLQRRSLSSIPREAGLSRSPGNGPPSAV